MLQTLFAQLNSMMCCMCRDTYNRFVVRRTSEERSPDGPGLCPV